MFWKQWRRVKNMTMKRWKPKIAFSCKTKNVVKRMQKFARWWWPARVQRNKQWTWITGSLIFFYAEVTTRVSTQNSKDMITVTLKYIRLHRDFLLVALFFLQILGEFRVIVGFISVYFLYFVFGLTSQFAATLQSSHDSSAIWGWNWYLHLFVTFCSSSFSIIKRKIT